MFNVFRSVLQRSPLLDAAIKSRPVTRWTWSRVFLLTIPFILLLNYLIIFQWTLISTIPRKVWSDASFHPTPYPLNTGSQKAAGRDYWTWSTQTQFHPRPKDFKSYDECTFFPTHLLDRIQVVLKVGAADGDDRTTSQLSTVIRCIPNILIASDLSHPYGLTHNASDVLASLPPSTYMKPEDLEVYEHQKNSTINGGDLTPGHDGWKIDKYKFLSEVEEAMKFNMIAQWYVFLESDTYIFWDNMFRLLENYDHKLPWYFGSPSPGRKIRVPKPGSKEGEEEEKKIWFAYGGTGFVLSSPAAHRLIDRPRNSLGVKGPRVTEEYKEDIQNDCCGDSILGWALHDKAKVDISGLWPMFNPHALHNVPFSKWYWCEPVITLHKTRTEDFEKLWRFENVRDRNEGPLLYKELIGFHELGDIEQLENWDAAYWDGFSEESSDHTSNQSLESCRQYCHEHDACYQFTWHAHHCWMSKGIYKGTHKDPDGEHSEEDRKYITGWDIEKIRAWMEENKCEDGAHWVMPSIERKF